MKWLILLLLQSSICLAELNPQQATALSFLEKVRSHQIRLTPNSDTAISDATTDDKRSTISDQILGIARDIHSSSLTPLLSYSEGSLGVVLVSSSENYNLDQIKIFPVTMVFSNEQWRPTPILGSFKNCGLGYDPATLDHTQKIENWIQSHTKSTLDSVKAQAIAKIQSDIAQAAASHHLNDLTAPDTLNLFLNACSNRDFLLAAALCQLHLNPLVDHWQTSINTLESSLVQRTPTNPLWLRLTSPSLLTFPVSHESSSSLCVSTLVSIDPTTVTQSGNTPAFHHFSLKLTRAANQAWRIVLTPDQLSSHADPFKNAEVSEDNLLDLTYPALMSLAPPSPSTTPQQARDKLLLALESNHCQRWLPLIHRPITPKATLLKSGYAIHSGLTYHQTTARKFPILIDEITIGNQHACAFQAFDPRQPDQANIHSYFFTHSEQGWFWDPHPSNEEMAPFGDWIRNHSTPWQNQWMSTLCQPITRFSAPPSSDPPSEQAALTTVQQFHHATANGHLHDALRLITEAEPITDLPNLIRTLSYEFTTQLTQKAPNTQLIASSSLNGITLIAVSTANTPADAYPCYAIIHSPTPKIILSTNLCLSNERTRLFLNKNTLKKLAQTNPNYASTIVSLFANLQAKIPKSSPNP